MRKVLLVSEAKALGGAEMYLERMASHLVGYQATLAVPASLGHWVAGLEEQGLNARPYGKGWGGVVALRTMAREVDVVHVNLPSTYDAWSGLLPWALSRIRPVVVTEHLTRIPRSRRREWIKRMTRDSIQTVICVSQASVEPHRRRGTPHVEVIPNGVPDPGPPQPVPQGPLRLGVLATLEERKRIHLAIEAVSELPQVELRIAGSGPQEGHLRDLARARCRPGQVHFEGFVRNPYRFLGGIHALMLCSDNEAMPLTLLEAFASGRGVITSSFPGAEEVVTPQTGCVVEESWKDALQRLSVERCEAWGRAARRRYEERFTLERWVSKTEAVYDRAVEDGP